MQVAAHFTSAIKAAVETMVPVEMKNTNLFSCIVANAKTVELGSHHKINSTDG